MEIKKVEDNFDWSKHERTFKPIYKVVREMAIGEVIEVTLDQPLKHFPALMGQYFRKSRFDYQVQTRKLFKNPENLKYLIRKRERPERKE